MPASHGEDAAWNVLRHGSPTVSAVVTDPSSGRSFVHAHVPVIRAGRVAYSLAMVVPSEQLSAILLQRHFPHAWLASLLDRGGRIAARTRNAASFVGQFSDAGLRSAALGNDTGTLETVTRDGIPSFTSYARSPRTGYTTVVAVPRAEVIGALWNRLAYLAAAVGVLFALGLMLARRASRRIARSIHVLIGPATALGEGTRLAVAPGHVSEAVEVGVAIERAAALLHQRDAALQAQKEELQQFEFFSEHANEQLLLLDQHARIRYANRMASRCLGYSKEELLSMLLFQIDRPATPELLREAFEHCRHAQLPPFERVYTRKDGSAFPVDITATVLEHRGEWLMHVAPRDISERRHAEQAIRWAASHDALTGLANRASALAFLDGLLQETGSAGGAVLYIDLDRLKRANDLHGHEVGDRVLQEVAHRIQACMGPDGLLARFGGDEFVAVLDEADARHAAHTAGAIIGALSQPISVGNIEVALSACIGISRFPEHGSTSSVLVHAADMAMLHVKQNGSAAFASYSPDMAIREQFVLDVERRLQRALDDAGFVLHYQPIVNLASGALDGVEALVRLADGAEPALGPAAFIPVAEACGLIGLIGEWVAREACRQQVRWQAEGLALTVAVNVSAMQFQRAGFCARIQALVASSGIDPRSLVIELTETAVMENLAEAIGILHELKAIGVRIALDDFGTGYSSLSSLSSLPLDKLKIDQSFVRRIDTDHASRAVIDAVIALGKSLKLELVAEGVETEAAMRYLRERGCRQGQGYYFSRPLPERQLLKWHQERQPATQEGRSAR